MKASEIKPSASVNSDSDGFTKSLCTRFRTLPQRNELAQLTRVLVYLFILHIFLIHFQFSIAHTSLPCRPFFLSMACSVLPAHILPNCSLLHSLPPCSPRSKTIEKHENKSRTRPTSTALSPSMVYKGPPESP